MSKMGDYKIQQDEELMQAHDLAGIFHQFNQTMKAKHMNVRMSCGNRWLYWSGDSENWCIREHFPYQHGSTLLYAGIDLTKALRILVEDD